MSELHWTGLIIGICTFLVIGIFHPLVTKGEYYFGVRCWWVFLIAGIIALVGALLIENVLWSSIVGVVSFSCFWSILEVFEQRERVVKGWFPMNPKRKADYESFSKKFFEKHPQYKK